MDNATYSRILLTRNAVLWTEIKSNKLEYERLQKQVKELEQAKNDLAKIIEHKIKQAQDIAEKLSEIEYETLTKYNL